MANLFKFNKTTSFCGYRNRYNCCVLCKNQFERNVVKSFTPPICSLRRQRWENSCGVKLESHMKICEFHFKDKDFINGQRNPSAITKLAPEAVPAFHPIDLPSNLKRIVVNGKRTIVLNSAAETITAPSSESLNVPPAKSVTVTLPKSSTVTLARSSTVPLAKSITLPSAKSITIPSIQREKLTANLDALKIIHASKKVETIAIPKGLQIKKITPLPNEASQTKTPNNLLALQARSAPTNANVPASTLLIKKGHVSPQKVVITRTGTSKSLTVNARSVSVVKIPAKIVSMNRSEVETSVTKSSGTKLRPGRAPCIPRVARKVKLGSFRRGGMVRKPSGQKSTATPQLRVAYLQMGINSPQRETPSPLKTTADPQRKPLDLLSTTSGPLRTSADLLSTSGDTLRKAASPPKPATFPLRTMVNPQRTTSTPQSARSTQQEAMLSTRLTTSPSPLNLETSFYTLDTFCQTEIPLEEGYKAEIYSLNRKIKAVEEENQELEKQIIYVNALKTKMSRIFTDCQMQRLKDPDKAIQWQENDMEIASNLYRSSPKVYQHLYDKGYPLPRITTIIKWLMNQIAKTTKNSVIVPRCEETESALANDVEMEETENVTYDTSDSKQCSAPSFKMKTTKNSVLVPRRVETESALAKGVEIEDTANMTYEVTSSSTSDSEHCSSPSFEMMTDEMMEETENYVMMEHEMIDPAINAIEINSDDEARLEDMTEEEIRERILGY